jgi:PII-like signaling protein
MKIETEGKLLTIYVNNTDQWQGQPLYAAIVQTCRQRGIAGVTVCRGVEGYGSSGHLHTTRLLELSEKLPVRIEIIDVADRIEPLRPLLEPMISEGLLTVQDVHVLRYLPDPKG